MVQKQRKTLFHWKPRHWHQASSASAISRGVSLHVETRPRQVQDVPIAVASTSMMCDLEVRMCVRAYCAYAKKRNIEVYVWFTPDTCCQRLPVLVEGQLRCRKLLWKDQLGGWYLQRSRKVHWRDPLHACPGIEAMPSAWVGCDSENISPTDFGPSNTPLWKNKRSLT